MCVRQALREAALLHCHGDNHGSGFLARQRALRSALERLIEVVARREQRRERLVAARRRHLQRRVVAARAATASRYALKR